MDFPHPALLGLTVDTWMATVYEVLGNFTRLLPQVQFLVRHARCVLTGMVQTVQKTVSNPVAVLGQGLVQTVLKTVLTTQLQLLDKLRLCPSFRQGWSSCRRRQLEVPQIRTSIRCSRSEEWVFAVGIRHFSHSVHLDVECQGGGDAGSLTPRCSANRTWCTVQGYRQRHRYYTTPTTLPLSLLSSSLPPPPPSLSPSPPALLPPSLPPPPLLLHTHTHTHHHHQPSKHKVARTLCCRGDLFRLDSSGRHERTRWRCEAAQGPPAPSVAPS